MSDWEKPKLNGEKRVAVVVEGVRLLVKQAHICGFNAPPPPLDNPTPYQIPGTQNNTNQRKARRKLPCIFSSCNLHQVLQKLPTILSFLHLNLDYFLPACLPSSLWLGLTPSCLLPTTVPGPGERTQVLAPPTPVPAKPTEECRCSSCVSWPAAPTWWPSQKPP